MAVEIPLLVPDMPQLEEITPWLRRIDESRWYTNYGPLNGEFENELAELLSDAGAVDVVTVANCTLGLELALQDLGLAPGAQVLTPAITFVATGTAVARVGLMPLICDVDEGNWLLTPDIARRALECEPFEAVLPVSTFGVGQDIAGWEVFTRDTGVPVVIDAAGALGNQPVGKVSAVVFSLHATKSLGVGEGGLVASQSKKRIRRIRRASNFGIDLTSPTGEAVGGGTNAKLSEYHAAVGLAALPRWRCSWQARQALYDTYRRELADRLSTAVVFQDAAHDRIHAILSVRIPGCTNMRRVLAMLARDGIGARQWYCPPLPYHDAFRKCPTVDDLPVSEQLRQELIGLPFYTRLETKQVRTVVDSLASALETA